MASAAADGRCTRDHGALTVLMFFFADMSARWRGSWSELG
jgi:hypothetical protein